MKARLAVRDGREWLALPNQGRADSGGTRSARVLLLNRFPSPSVGLKRIASERWLRPSPVEASTEPTDDGCLARLSL
jgi:hypothetical protein